MPLIGDRAICLRKVAFSETSQILSIFTHGRGLVRVIAKGAHRTTKAGASKFDGGLDLLDEGEALFTDRLEKDLNILTEWKLIDGHRSVRSSLRGIYLALYAAEIIDRVFEAHDPHPNVFARFAASIEQLPTPACEEVALALVLDLLLESGYLPVLDRCVNCDRTLGNERSVFYSPERGGVVCAACETQVADRRPINPKLIGIANMVLKLPRVDGLAVRLPRLTRTQTDPLQAMLFRHLAAHTQQNYRLARFVLPWRKSPAPATQTPPQPAPAGPPDASSQVSEV